MASNVWTRPDYSTPSTPPIVPTAIEWSPPIKIGRQPVAADGILLGWAGTGIVLVAGVSAVLYKQVLDFPTILGLPSIVVAKRFRKLRPYKYSRNACVLLIR